MLCTVLYSLYIKYSTLGFITSQYYSVATCIFSVTPKIDKRLKSNLLRKLSNFSQSQSAENTGHSRIILSLCQPWSDSIILTQTLKIQI